jgi:protein-S-isoprenylcysteine O-methyltransferase Ste14
MALALGEFRGLVGLALMVAAVWHKGRTEERFLLAEFDDDYADYQREVGFLIPRVV